MCWPRSVSQADADAADGPDRSQSRQQKRKRDCERVQVQQMIVMKKGEKARVEIRGLSAYPVSDTSCLILRYFPYISISSIGLSYKCHVMFDYKIFLLLYDLIYLMYRSEEVGQLSVYPVSGNLIKEINNLTLSQILTKKK